MNRARTVTLARPLKRCPGAPADGAGNATGPGHRQGPRSALQRTPIVTALLVGSLISSAASVDARETLRPPPTFEARFIARFSSHLCEADYMRCLGADRETCRAAVATSPRACPLGSLYEAVARPHATAGHARAAIADASIALGHCVTARVERALALRFGDFPRCFDEFEARTGR